MTNYIWITTQFEGIHNWKACPIKDVDFLKYPHRHKIYIIVTISIYKDRDIEYFMFKKDVDKIIIKLYGKDMIKLLGTRSMETIGKEIIIELKKKYIKNKIKISVSEDNQVGSIIYSK